MLEIPARPELRISSMRDKVSPAEWQARVS
jgi:hypothetical protein